MATDRVRTREGNPTEGYNYVDPRWGGGVEVYTRIDSKAWMRDNTGPKPYADRPMLGWKVQLSGGVLNGPCSTGRFVNKPGIMTASEPGHLNDGTDNSFINRVLSQSGPQTPRVHLPLFVYELKDLPRMLRHAGDLLHGLKRPSGLSLDKEAASATLAYQFGWAPLIQDIDRMVKFSEAVRKRQLELSKAHTTKGLRRRVNLGDVSSHSDIDNHYVNSTHGFIMTTRAVSKTTSERWATLRWTVRDTTQIGRQPTFTEAFRSAYGLNAGHIPIQVWKGIPWSWAIDWFGDFSNLLTANYNSIYYRPSPICMMKKTVREITYYPKTSTNGRSFSGGKSVATRIQRTVLPASSTFRMKLPFMDSFKLSILGSMTILRIRGR